MRTSLYLPDDLAALVKRYGISISEVAQRALRQEVHVMEAMSADAERVTVKMRDGRVGFIGRWLIDPADDVRSGEPNADRGTFYGVAVTAKGNFVVYAAHVAGRLEPEFRTYSSLDHAIRDDCPSDVIERAKSALDPDYVRWIDI